MLAQFSEPAAIFSLGLRIEHLARVAGRAPGELGLGPAGSGPGFGAVTADQIEDVKLDSRALQQRRKVAETLGVLQAEEPSARRRYRPDLPFLAEEVGRRGFLRHLAHGRRCG